MVTLLLDRAKLEIVLSWTERRLGRLPRSVRVDRSTISKVQLTADPWTWLRGERRRGTHVPGLLALGTWNGIPGDDLVVVRGRRLPGVVIDLAGDERYVRLLLSTSHGLALTRALNREVVTPSDVAAFGPAEKPHGAPARAPRPVPAV